MRGLMLPMLVSKDLDLNCSDLINFCIRACNITRVRWYSMGLTLGGAAWRDAPGTRDTRTRLLPHSAFCRPERVPVSHGGESTQCSQH